jgi:hypothetical protein
MKQNNPALIQTTNWQTQSRGTNDSEYQIYLHNMGDKNGLCPDGKPLKSYNEWLNS